MGQGSDSGVILFVHIISRIALGLGLFVYWCSLGEEVPQQTTVGPVAQERQSYLAGTPPLSEPETLAVRKSLASYEKGDLTLQQVTLGDGLKTAASLIKYYEANSNEVTLRMLLPVSRSYVVFGIGTNAARCAQQYVNVYSNDFRGWNVLGASRSLLRDLNGSLLAWSKSIELGDNSNLAVAGGVAYRLDKKSFVEDSILPGVLKAIHKEQDVEIKCEMLKFLTYYGVEEKREDLYLVALRDLSAGDVAADKELKRDVYRGRKLFKAQEVQRLSRILLQ